jgi:nucleoside-diphosphate-sugar epimerase
MQAKQERITGFHVLNLCTGVSSTINELIKLIGGIVQNEPNISHEKAREGDVYHSLGSDELSRQLLNYKAHYSLEAGLLEWYQSYC